MTKAIYWAQKYPDEIKVIIGLDPAIPEAYDILKIPSAAVINTIGFLTRKGVHKPFVKAICKKDTAVQSGYLTEAEIETYINRVITRTNKLNYFMGIITINVTIIYTRFYTLYCKKIYVIPRSWVINSK